MKTDSARKAFALASLASGLRFRGDEHDAIETSEQAEQTALRERDEDALIMPRWISRPCGDRPVPPRLVDGLHREDRGGRGRVLERADSDSYGSILNDLCLPERALERDLECLETADSSIWRFGREAAIQSRLNIAADRLMLGAVAEARSQLEHVQGQIDVVETTRIRWLSRFHPSMRRCLRPRDELSTPRRRPRNCLGMASEFGQPKYEVRGRLARALALAALDEREHALEESRRAGRLAQAQGYAGLAWR